MRMNVFKLEHLLFPQISFDDTRVGSDLGGKSGNDRFAVLHDHNAIGHPHDQAHVVLDKQNGNAEFVAQPIDQRLKVAFFLGIEPRGRLVEHKQPRLRDPAAGGFRSEENKYELTSLMRISYAVLYLKKN